MRDELFFNGKALSDFGVQVKGESVYNSPERDIENISIPGRNGDLTIDNGRYKNISVKYPAYILKDFKQASYFDAFRAFMVSNIGYKRIEDTYHPEEYRIGKLSASITPEVFERGNAGTFEVEFDCKPQRYLKDGELAIELTANSGLMNYTLYEAKPLLRVYGVGTFSVAGVSVTITSANTYTDIDCDLMDAFKGSTNCNGNIVLNSGSFPTLPSGESQIVLNTGITKIEITPRWWTL